MERNSRIVYCSISAFGQDGPRREIPAHDLAVEALAGVLSVNVDDDMMSPSMPGIPAADMAGSLHGAIRNSDGASAPRKKPAEAIASIYPCTTASWRGCPTCSVPCSRRIAPRIAEKTSAPGAAPRSTDIYATRDGRQVVLGAQEMKFVRALLAELGRPELAALCTQGPGPHQRPLIDFLRGVFKQRTQSEWVDWFRGRDVSFAPIQNLREALDDPQLAARDMVLRDADGHRHLGIPIKFAQEPG